MVVAYISHVGTKLVYILRDCNRANQLSLPHIQFQSKCLCCVCALFSPLSSTSSRGVCECVGELAAHLCRKSRANRRVMLKGHRAGATMVVTFVLPTLTICLMAASRHQHRRVLPQSAARRWRARTPGP